MNEGNTVYLAGKITGEPRYKEIFAVARERLEAAGFIVLDPSLLPASGFAYDAYIRISTAMMDECAAVCFLHNWQDSRGARYEYARAAARKMPAFFFEEWERANNSIEGLHDRLKNNLKAHEYMGLLKLMLQTVEGLGEKEETMEAANGE